MSSVTPRLSMDKEAIINKCVEEGWTLNRIRREHGISRETVKKRYPDYASPARFNKITEEKLELIRKAIEDGWPLTQIIKTHKVAHATLRIYFPDFRGLDLAEAGALGGFTRDMNKKIRK